MLPFRERLLDPQRPIRSRFTCLLGFLISSALLCLGGIWPSFYTFVAILAIPAPFFFLIGLIWPQWIFKHRGISQYLIYIIVASIACCGLFAFLLLFFVDVQ